MPGPVTTVSSPAPDLPPAESPFALAAEAPYLAWRERKLAGYPRAPGELIVEVKDPRSLAGGERDALLERCRKANMAIYVSTCGDDPDKEIPVSMGRQLGLTTLDHNWLADDDAVTSLTVNPAGRHPEFIPYTNRPIHWHTDGYYNDPGHQVRGLLLHCVRPAARGGANALMDPEIVYLRLRDENPAYIAALMHPRAMTIPARSDNGRITRDERAGPVFSISADGDLHMRYTARRHNVRWREDPVLQAALTRLEELLGNDGSMLFHTRLESGMGLVSNNVLHDRSGFEDPPGERPRLLYRARYYERIRAT